MFLASQMQKDHSIEHLVNYFIVVLMVRLVKPKHLKEYKTDLEQYALILFRSMYLLTLALCQASMFSSHGQPSSMRITLLSLLEKTVVSGISSVNAVWGDKEKVPPRSPNKTQSET